jgi:lipid-A-disaccharide synthase-like uncharacterized protein
VIASVRPAALVLVAVVAVVAVPGAAVPIDGGGPDRGVELELRPEPAGVKQMRIETAADGSRTVVLTMVDGRQERLKPDELIARIDEETRQRRWLYRLLNITGPIGIAWVVLGLLGQVVFAGRMIVQWLISERSRRSVVPVAFWWMSLAGASMLLVYFLWRRDIVGVLGQCTGWIIYLRNLVLIYRERRGS